MKKKFRSGVMLLLSTIIWGSAFVSQSAGMDLIGPFTFQAVRCFLAVVALIPLIVIFDIRQNKNFIKEWLNPRLWTAGLFCGSALFVAQNLQQVGLVYTDPGKSGFITAMYIVFVPIISIFLKKKPGINVLISVVIAVIGLYLLSCVGVETVNIGDLLTLGCAIAFAVQILLIDRFAAGIDCLRLNCLQALIVSVLSAVFMVVTEQPQIDSILACWLPLCHAGMLSMGLAYTFQIIGQRHLEPATASLIMSMESVFAVIFSWLILNEQLSPSEYAGCALVFTAVILSQLPIHDMLAKKRPK